jgi:hypothetical protein
MLDLNWFSLHQEKLRETNIVEGNKILDETSIYLHTYYLSFCKF